MKKFVGLLIAGQSYQQRHPPKSSLQVVRHPNGDNPRRPANGPAIPGKRVFHDGAVVLQDGEFPILGAPQAPHLVVVLADYTCPHCRKLHGMLVEARKRYGGQFAVMIVPTPMNGKCNGAVASTAAIHENACELAKLALAVWRANPSAFEKIDAALFNPAAPPTPEEARAILQLKPRA